MSKIYQERRRRVASLRVESMKLLLLYKNNPITNNPITKPSPK